MGLIPDKFTHVYVLDTEYIALPGEPQEPVALVAKGFKKARDIRLFFDEPQANPFVSDPESTLFIGFNVASEYKCFLPLGWPLPQNTIDLMVEYKNLTNGVYRGKDSLWDLGTGLQDVVREMGGNPLEFWRGNKDEERQYIIANGTTAPGGVSQEEHRQRILSYCEEDCIATHFCAQQMFKMRGFDFDQALHRGAFSVSVAHFEDNGLPVDAERFEAIRRDRVKLQTHIAQEIEAAHGYGVYVVEGREDLKNKPHPVFKMKKFAELLEKNGITVGKRGSMWDATDGGQPVLEDDYFEQQCNVYPWLQPLRQCRKSINSLGRFETVLGKDGMNRYTLWPFGTVTSRNNPKAKEFLLSRPHWLRNLLKPKPGMAIVACDITGAEDWLAAGFSGDPKLMEIYSSGKDSYMEFAAEAEMVPRGTARRKQDRELERVRAQFKVAKLAIQYGVGEGKLSKQLGVPVWRAGLILNAHRKAYNVYWQWVEDQQKLADRRGYVETDYGWRQSTEHMNDRNVMNFPQQASCAELLRLACGILVDEGWGYAFAAPHHDALYMHCELGRADICANAVEDAFVEAGNMLMEVPSFPLRVHANIVRWPDHYVDAAGEEIWRIVCQFFRWDEFSVSEQEEESDERLLAHAS